MGQYRCLVLQHLTNLQDAIPAACKAAAEELCNIKKVQVYGTTYNQVWPLLQYPLQEETNCHPSSAVCHWRSVIAEKPRCHKQTREIPLVVR